MRQYNPKEYVFSLHIPKSGGTSFTETLKKWFWPGFHAHYFDHQFNRMPLPIRKFKPPLHKLGIYPMCIHGHFEEECGVYETYPNAKQFITLLRDPLELQISLFFDHQRRLKDTGALYWKGEKVEMEFDSDLDTWVKERPSFLMKFLPWDITKENYKEVLNQHFIHIGVTEYLQKSIDIFAEKLNKKTVQIPHLNKSERFQQASDEAIKIFKEKHELEYLIYDYAVSLNK
ncbi:hypothetical protein [Labilibacter marinus]|uniref:hypothetical protein n=1 Tax=Labilibacter marinus TaxID=1477105 RepID=UPI00094FAA6F|nr:hypothetical protein [Labilibacter marinus]